jgi:hypothetical protein
MKILKRVTESEVITEFLKNEFYQAEFDRDREHFENMVMEGDLTDEQQNAIRRALLFRRRGHMWRELPSDTQWYEAELLPADLDRVRVFPRAHWRSFANGSFAIKDIAQRIRMLPNKGRCDAVISKIQLIRYRMQRERLNSSILLIGVDEQQPLTIIEGNHRLTAGLLISPEAAVQGLRIFCGLSARMADCCWYRTNLPNLLNYARNRLLNLVDREADVSRVLPNAPGTALKPTFSKVAGGPGAAAATEPKQV